MVSQSVVVSNGLWDGPCQDSDVVQLAKRRWGPSQDWELLYSISDMETRKRRLK